MLWHLFLIPFAIANELITLSPVSQPTQEAASESLESNLFIGDSLICNSEECYPKVFEPTEFWQEVKPAQHLPGGLDIKMNLETGLKEAKLSSDAPNAKFATDNADANEETTEYEFSKDFGKVRKLLDEKDYGSIETVLDDMVDFSHDYKHGYKIVVHEFPLLKDLMFSEHIPKPIRELSARILTGCLRNNPPALEYVNQNDPNFVMRLFNELDLIISSSLDNQTKGLIKRFLSIIQSLVNHTPSELNEDTLSRLYRIRDKQIKIRVLEIMSNIYQTLPLDTGSVKKRSLESTDVQKWFNEFATLIQDDDVDELHIREFFNSMYNLKKELGKSIKVDPSFLNWLSEEGEKRNENLQNGIHERDLEQDDFDRQLIESRHLLFGNPMAHRIKHFEDEL